ncbi:MULTISPECIES: MYXO-CTERM sorting domain-containing protein [Sphingobium]|uniref:MYXO-CTERM sorting domain-containing protein n=1 Tax=Sphingobium tyrosinilyticum TaxID=2715436 RepID=A0ABV9ETN8_9SPHN|nr:MYXO-CTERM sorting domain-containing protein [Sphingobium sp. EP60837]ANI77569.1 hypothetical protein EP837_01135 [Sphingobium sp. EP60837]
MTHKPHVPAGSQSPYPLHPAPMQQTLPRSVPVSPPEERQARALATHSTGWTIGVGLAVIALSFLFLRRR